MKMINWICRGAKEAVAKNGIRKGAVTIASKILYRFTTGLVAQVYRVIKLPIQDNLIVFESNPDFSDNARVLFNYMCSNGYNKKYKLCFFVANPEKYKEYEGENVFFVRNKGKRSGCRTLKFYYYSYTAKILFFTHSFNWFHKYNKNNQLFIDLWHGCGYKAAKGNSKQIYFNYLLVPAKIFKKTKAEFFDCSEDKLIDLGYPRYDLLNKKKDVRKPFFDSLHVPYDGRKIIMWMPTYRKSYRATLSEGTLDSPFDLPLMYSYDDLLELDECCRKNNVLLIIKKHYLEQEMPIDKGCIRNILFIENEQLEQCEIQLYELLNNVDALITDYSSVAIDFLLTSKPIGFTLDDYEQYKDSRGFVFEDPLQYMPGMHMVEKNQLYEFIQDVSIGKDEYREERAKVLQETHNVTDNYCKRILEYFDIK